MKESDSECDSVMSDSLWPKRILQARIWGLAFPFSRDLPNPGIQPRSPSLQADSLLSELPGKPKNTGIGSLSLLQGIFLTQGWNRGPLHCRWILYQLNYLGYMHIYHWITVLYTYIHIYIYVCVCVCVCICLKLVQLCKSTILQFKK